MSLVEGFGDEVVILCVVLFLLSILCAAWMSTGVAEIPRINVVFLNRERFRNVLASLSSLPGVSIVRTSFGYIIGHNQNQAAQAALEPGQNIEAPNSVNSSGGTVVDSVNTDSNTEENATNTAVPDETDNSNNPSVTENVTDTLPSVETQATESVVQREVSSLTNLSSGTSEPLSGDQLRKRRLEFLQKKSTSSDSKSAIETQNSEADAQDAENTHVSSTERENTNNESNEQKVNSSCSESHSAQGNSVNHSEEVSPETPQVNAEPEREDGKIRIKIVFLDQRQKYVQSKPEDTVETFKRTHFAAELSENYNVRLIHSGQEMKLDQQTLESYRLKDSSVVHCILRQVMAQEQHNGAPTPTEFDVGSLLLPLFGLILALIWYCRFTYRNYFNATSTLSLMGITFVFGLSVLASIRWRGEEHLHDD